MRSRRVGAGPVKHDWRPFRHPRRDLFPQDAERLQDVQDVADHGGQDQEREQTQWKISLRQSEVTQIVGDGAADCRGGVVPDSIRWRVIAD